MTPISRRQARRVDLAASERPHPNTHLPLIMPSHSSPTLTTTAARSLTVSLAAVWLVAQPSSLIPTHTALARDP